jgi:hypothetical protein
MAQNRFLLINHDVSTSQNEQHIFTESLLLAILLGFLPRLYQCGRSYGLLCQWMVLTALDKARRVLKQDTYKTRILI